MNPDTNRFEMLKSVEELFEDIPETQLESMKKMFVATNSKLVRPNGKPVPGHWSIFKVGEEVVIKNYTFKVAYIGETSILFEPVGIVEIGKGK